MKLFLCIFRLFLQLKPEPLSIMHGVTKQRRHEVITLKVSRSVQSHSAFSVLIVLSSVFSIPFRVFCFIVFCSVLFLSVPSRVFRLFLSVPSRVFRLFRSVPNVPSFSNRLCGILEP